MPALKKHEIDRFKRDPLSGGTVRVVLIHGPDAGAVSELADRVAQSALTSLGSGCDTINLDEDSLIASPDMMANAVRSQGLFASATLLRIRRAGSGIGKALAASEENWNDKCFAIVEAEGLKRDSSLRRWFEASAKNRVSIALYTETAQDLESLVTDILAASKVKANREVVSTIVAQIGEDRSAARSELEKLLLYVHGKDSLSMQDIADVFLGSEVKTVSRLIEVTFGGNTAGFDAAFRSVWSIGFGGIALLNIALRHIVSLQGMVGAREDGLRREDTMALLGMYNSPMFWSLERQVAIWTTSALQRSREAIFETSRSLRNSGVPERTLVHRVLLRCATQAERLRGRS